MAKIAVLGYGTVGSGVVEVIDTNAEELAKSAGEKEKSSTSLTFAISPGISMRHRLSMT